MKRIIGIICAITWFALPSLLAAQMGGGMHGGSGGMVGSGQQMGSGQRITGQDMRHNTSMMSDMMKDLHQTMGSQRLTPEQQQQMLQMMNQMGNIMQQMQGPQTPQMEQQQARQLKEMQQQLKSLKAQAQEQEPKH